MLYREEYGNNDFLRNYLGDWTVQLCTSVLSNWSRCDLFVIPLNRIHVHHTAGGWLIRSFNMDHNSGQISWRIMNNESEEHVNVFVCEYILPKKPLCYHLLLLIVGWRSSIVAIYAYNYTDTKQNMMLNSVELNSISFSLELYVGTTYDTNTTIIINKKLISMYAICDDFFELWFNGYKKRSPDQRSIAYHK